MFKEIKLIDLIKDQKVHFDFYRDNELWYSTDNGFKFPVPISKNEIGTATFLRDDKAVLLMRYIRKYLEELQSEETERDKREACDRDCKACSSFKC
jgi:hypothetical protein